MMRTRVGRIAAFARTDFDVHYNRFRFVNQSRFDEGQQREIGTRRVAADAADVLCLAHFGAV